MSAHKKPGGGSPPQASALAAMNGAFSELTPAEIRWVMAYRMMDRRRRSENLPFMEDTAHAYPMRAKLDTPAVAHGIRLAAVFGKAVIE